MEFDLSIDMGHKQVSSEPIDCHSFSSMPWSPIKFDLPIENGHKPVPEGSNASRPVASEIALPQFPFTEKVWSCT